MTAVFGKTRLTFGAEANLSKTECVPGTERPLAFLVHKSENVHVIFGPKLKAVEVKGLEEWKVSPDGTACAYLVKGAKPGDEVLTIAGKTVKGLDIRDFGFGADGTPWHLAGKPKPDGSSADSWNLYVGQDKSPAFAGTPNCYVFGPTLKSCLIVGRAKPEDALDTFFDGKPLGIGSSNGEVVATLDGRHIACVLSDAKRQLHVWADGALVGDAWKHPYGLTLSPDGSSLAFINEVDGDRFVIENGVQSEKWASVEVLGFSPDGKRFRYIGHRDIRKTRNCYVEGGRCGPESPNVSQAARTPAGDVLYTIRTEEGSTVMKGDQELARTEGKSAGAVAVDRNIPVFIVDDGAGRHVVSAEGASDPFDEIGGTVWDPETGKVLWIGRRKSSGSNFVGVGTRLLGEVPGKILRARIATDGASVECIVQNDRTVTVVSVPPK